MKDQELVRIASDIKKNAYAPYSGFRVGAAVVTQNNKLYTGVNVENTSYGATNCAERTAIFKAVSDGERKIKAVAVNGDSDEYVYPCGICRQVLAEFGDQDTKIICSNKNGDFKTYTLKELLPNIFKA